MSPRGSGGGLEGVVASAGTGGRWGVPEDIGPVAPWLDDSSSP
jgi:hypothetical protein